MGTKQSLVVLELEACFICYPDPLHRLSWLLSPCRVNNRNLTTRP